MRNPCIDCPDRKDNISDCEGPHYQKKREAYLKHIQNDGTCFDGVKPVADSRLPVVSKREDLFPNATLSKGASGGCMEEKINKGVETQHVASLQDDTQVMRICKGCKSPKPLHSAFSKAKKGKDGYEGKCKKCRKEEARNAWRKRQSAEGTTVRKCEPKSVFSETKPEVGQNAKLRRGILAPGAQIVCIEFADERDNELFERLVAEAKTSRRSVEQQIMWILEGNNHNPWIPAP